MAPAKDNMAERIAVLETEVKNVKDIVLRMEAKLDAASNLYVTQSQLIELRQNLEAEMAAMRASRWRDVVIQVLITASVAGLIGYAFGHVIK